MNMINTYRQRLIQAITYFASKVKKPSKLKIFKLLYFFDFKHIKQTGISVTALDYFALKWGPVPMSFYDAINDDKLPEDFQEYVSLVPFKAVFSSKSGAMFKAKKKPDLSVFTPRQIKILEELVFLFKNLDAKDISEVSHLKNEPWDNTIKQKGLNKRIDYVLAIDDDSDVTKEDVEYALEERKEMLKNFPPVLTV